MTVESELLGQFQAAGFKKPTPETAATGGIVGVSVPISIDRDGAKVRLYLHLSPDCIKSPDTLNATLDQIESVFDLDAWRPRSSDNGSGFKKQRNYGGHYK